MIGADRLCVFMYLLVLAKLLTAISRCVHPDAPNFFQYLNYSNFALNANESNRFLWTFWPKAKSPVKMRPIPPV